MRRTRLYILIVALLVAIGCLIRVAKSGSTVRVDVAHIDAQTADSIATPEAKTILQELARYTRDPSAGILSGQNVGIAGQELRSKYRQTWSKLISKRNCPTPAIMTVDLAQRIPKHRSFLTPMQRHVERGGFVGMSMHPPNPWTSKDSWDVKNVSYEELMSPGSRANKRYTKWLREVADILEELQNRNVTVLWRPLHEANGDWFWWGYGGEKPCFTEEQYKELWRSLFRYFVKERDLHNLLWIYCSSVRVSNQIVRFDVAYPGDDYVDLVALDYYGYLLSDMRADYKKLASFGKVMCVCEYGPMPVVGPQRQLDAEAWLFTIKSGFPEFAYFCSWHSWPGAAIALADHEQAPQLLKDPFVVNLEDIVKRRSEPTR